jgi:hypothetical protein
MKLNLTTVLLMGILGLVAFKLLQPQAMLGAGGGSPQANPAGGTTTTGPQDVFNSILGAAQGIFNAVSSIAQSSSKTA